MLRCPTVADTWGYQIDEAAVIFWGTRLECLAAKRGSTGD
jgi:hypothetical protein